MNLIFMMSLHLPERTCDPALQKTLLLFFKYQVFLPAVFGYSEQIIRCLMRLLFQQAAVTLKFSGKARLTIINNGAHFIFLH